VLAVNGSSRSSKDKLRTMSPQAAAKTCLHTTLHGVLDCILYTVTSVSVYPRALILVGNATVVRQQVVGNKL
jgi:hypothetical protein